MAYALIINKQAKKTLQSLSRLDRNRIVEKITILGKDPDNPLLDIKILQGLPIYRLRVGNWRILFDIDEDLTQIAIHSIKPRGGAYK